MLVACTDHGDIAESKERLCERLRDHVIDLRVSQSVAPTPSAQEFARIGEKRPAQQQLNDSDRHRAAMKQALGEEYVSTCAATLTSEQVVCSLNANDTASIVSCQSGSR